MGRKSKSKKLFSIKRGTLKKFGYSGVDKLTVKQRHRSLKKAMNRMSCNKLLHKLNAVAVLNKNREPSVSRKFRADYRWVKSQKNCR